MRRVLVVDDDHLVRKGFIGMMPWQKHGFEVVGEASNGEKALELLQSIEVDLLITDLAMPVMSGMELMKKVKEKHLRTEFVVLTFHHDFELIQEALRLGAVDYITKVELEHEQMDEVLRRISERISLPAKQVPDRVVSTSHAAWQPENEEISYSKEVQECIRNAVAYLHEEFQNEVHLSDVARKVNMSRSYFSRCFKDITGRTVNDLLRGIRIDYAKNLLLNSNKPVQWIAVQSGYTNEKYFFKVFREVTGMLPLEFRKAGRNPGSRFQVNVK
jgi:two-component system, response regulator YesN